MSRILNRVVLCFALLSCRWFSENGWTQSPLSSFEGDAIPPASAYVTPAQTIGSFQVYLEWASPEVEVGEPVWVRLVYTKIRENSQDRFQATWSLSGDVRLFIQYPGAPPVRIMGAFPQVVPYGSVFDVPLWETQRLEMFALWTPEAFSGLIFERPGTYRAHLQVKCQAGSGDEAVLSLPDIPIKVRPAALEGAKALNYLNTIEDLDLERDFIRDLQGEMAMDRTAPLMRTFLEKAPQSPLAPFVLNALIRYERKNSREQEAIQLGRQLQHNYPRHLLADDGLRYVAESLRALGNDSAAQTAVLQLYFWYPHTNRLRSIDPIFKELIAPAIPPADRTAWMLFEPGTAPSIDQWKTMRIDALKAARAAVLEQIPTPTPEPVSAPGSFENLPTAP